MDCFAPLVKRGRLAACGVLSLLGCLATSARTGGELQALLESGEDVVLAPGEVIEVAQALKVSHKGQAFYTLGAESAADFATIRHGVGSSGTLIAAKGISGVLFRDLILDGNRAGFRLPKGKLDYAPMLSLGGNGRSLWEKPFGWGDDISTVSRDTLIRNNLIYDVTDEGVMVQGGPGSKVLGNVVVAVSREMLGGIALIDPFNYYLMESEEEKRFDYRGVRFEDNWIVALGSRVHAGLPMGGETWNPNFGGTQLVGATVKGNLISGKAAGYGYVVSGIDGFVVEGNRSDATYSGVGDGLSKDPPDAPEAFLFVSSEIGSSSLQPEFQLAKRHLKRVLRSNRVPSDPMGYRDAGYPEPEAAAIVETAYLEMLGRGPHEEELAHWTGWLKVTHANADALRSRLMADPEFIERFGYANPLELHKWRGDRWLSMIVSTCTELQAEGNGDWPDAIEFHTHIVEALTFRGVPNE